VKGAGDLLLISGRGREGKEKWGKGSREREISSLSYLLKIVSAPGEALVIHMG